MDQLSPPLEARTALEVELKLALAPEDVAKLRRHPLLAERSVGRATTRRLHTVYFDTPDLQLADQGIALRVRRVGRRFVQTLKTKGSATAGLFARVELEAPVPGEAPVSALIAEPELRAAVEAAGPLAPAVETDFRRTGRRLQWDGTEVQLDLDEGEVRTANGNVPIAELELELVRGQPGALYELAIELSSAVTLRPAREGKVDRGFALLRSEIPRATRASALRHAEGATLGDVIGNVVAAATAQVQANESIARAGVDPEGVHQMRVGLRRLRAAFSVFKRNLPVDSLTVLRREARWLAGELGFVRDLDVFSG